MSRLSINKVSMRNFGKVRKSEVEFPKSGFVFVTGRNLTGTESFESIGSGKTTLGLAISKALFGITGRYKKPQKFSTDGAGDTYVEVLAEIEGNPLKVEFGYKCDELSKTGEGLRFTLGNGAPTMFGDISETRAELTKIVSVKPDVAGWTVFVDGDAISFDSLSESKTVSLLMDLLNQPPWESYKLKADKAWSVLDKSLNRIDGARSENASLLVSVAASIESAAQRLLSAKNSFDSATASHAERGHARAASKLELEGFIAVLRSSIASKEKEIKNAEQAEAEKYAVAEQARLTAFSDLNAAQRELGEMRQFRESAGIELEQFKGQYNQEISSYRESSYSQLNSARILAIAQRSKVESANSKASSDYQLSVTKKESAAQLASNNYSSAYSALERAREALETEKNSPSVCPLSGCGKTWPKDNAAKLADLQAKVQAAEKKEEQTRQTSEKLAAELDTLIKSPPIAEELPEIPEEKVEIPPHPHENSWQEGIQIRTAELEVKKQVCTQKESEIELLQGQLTQAEAGVAALKSCSAIPGLSQEIEKLEQKIAEHDRSIRTLELEGAQDVVDRSALTSAEQALETVQEQEAQLKLTKEAKELEFIQVSQQVAIAKYWSDAFSPTGIPNLIVKESIGPLNVASKKISTHITGGLIEVSYSTSKKLASGKERNEIVLHVKNPFGSSFADTSSKGESGLLNFITAETLAEVGNISARVGYKFYDEIATSQDPRVRRSIFAYIREKASRNSGLLFVVDHSPEVASFADYTLIAEKRSDGVTYHWA